METIEDRLRKLIEVVTENRHRDQKMFETTGISADKWKNFWFGRKAADANMIESVAKTWPEFAFWLVTGIQDPFRGHRSPDEKEVCYDSPALPRKTARDVFLIEMEIAKLCAVNGWPRDVDSADFWDYQHGIYTHKDAHTLSQLRQKLFALHMIRREEEATLSRLELREDGKTQTSGEPESKP